MLGLLQSPQGGTTDLTVNCHDNSEIGEGDFNFKPSYTQVELTFLLK
jgi:hypothetical protein